jgi:hypothetical protein
MAVVLKQPGGRGSEDVDSWLIRVANIGRAINIKPFYQVLPLDLFGETAFLVGEHDNKNPHVSIACLCTVPVPVVFWRDSVLVIAAGVANGSSHRREGWWLSRLVKECPKQFRALM